MKIKIITIMLLCSCAKNEVEVPIDLCTESCIERNVHRVLGNELDAKNYCVDVVFPEVKCYTINNENFYYR